MKDVPKAAVHVLLQVHDDWHPCSILPILSGKHRAPDFGDRRLSERLRNFVLECRPVLSMFLEQKAEGKLGAEINPPYSAAKVDEMGTIQRSTMLTPYKGGARIPGFDEVPSNDYKELRICY